MKHKCVVDVETMIFFIYISLQQNSVYKNVKVKEKEDKATTDNKIKEMKEKTKFFILKRRNKQQQQQTQKRYQHVNMCVKCIILFIWFCKMEE